MFNIDELNRYMKQLLLPEVGIAGQEQLKQAKVLVVGAGGLGCPILQYLAAIGIGTLGMVDGDVVDVSNLHRQVLYMNADIGRNKTVAAAEKLAAQNPHVILQQHPVFLNEENCAALMKDYDLIIDGCDNFATRYVVNDTAVALNKPLVYGSILGYEAQLAIFNYKGSKHLRHLFPEPPNPEDVPSCSVNGVLGTVPGILGTLMAQAAVSVLLGNPQFVNTFIVLNTLTLDRVKLSF
ncbi:HesA/MoeB/ThiF family protein [Filimonas effusa]|uniref:HesA/MoeB/ThiF family protein n=1 Tax=Filimonas effusa TaxID=2508721 RepID=A0A4Q1CZD2_9BACT|nr:HesA/MoeB/ThiF family protein [Filimonas effusa]RXK80760.1 HesA/MoeB/ThiF family protein [Filimonas effusa]